MISEQLLRTKLTIPQRRAALVSRPRLFEHLNSGLDGKLILISAPAGFGKTTLITDWISHVGRPVAWLSLDGGDNDPGLCMEYFIGALRTIKPKVGASALRLFRSSPKVPIKTILTDLINEICSLPGYFILILDDYHTITNKNIHSALGLLLENLPPNMLIVILTRADPPLYLAYLRGRGQLTELRANDLRFTLEETTEFLNENMKLGLNQEEISSLDARSEGWAAGLQMAAVSLKGRINKAEFIDAFSGNNRNITDYLFEEVFRCQSADMQSFMLETAILDQLTGPLCDAVTGRTDSSLMLEIMKKANLFVLALDDEGRWYRYHRLFADLLLNSLKNSKPQMVSELYKRASLWYEQNGLAIQAIEHALLGKDFSLASILIIRHAETTLMNGELATFKRWTLSLPEENIKSNPVLIIYQVLADLWLHGGSLKREEEKLQEIAQLDTQGQLTGAVLAVQAILSTVHGETLRSVDLANRALAILPPESKFWRSIAIPCLGQFSLLRGVLPAIPIAIDLFNEAVEMGRKTGNLSSTALGLRRLAEAHIAAGQLHEARACYQKIIDSATDSRGKLLPWASFGLIGLGSLARAWRDLDRAVAFLNQGIQLASGKLGLWQIEGYVNLARIRDSQGDTIEADKLIYNARQLTSESPDSKEFDIFISANEILMFLRRGNLSAATQWAMERGLSNAGNSEVIGEVDQKAVAGYYSSELELITFSRVCLAQGNLGEAIQLLETLSRSAEGFGRIGIIIEILMLEALAYKASGKPEKALDLLKRSLMLAEPGRYISLFVDEGVPMANLLFEAAKQKITPEYTQCLLQAFSVPAPKPELFSKPSKIAEPLSDRELDVLALLAQGLSNKEISHRLSIELRTVKWHTGNIFGKLGVKNRTQAVARAREIEIL